MIDLVLTVVVGVLGCALLLTVVVIWSIKRHRDPRLRIESDTPLAELLPSLSGLTHGAAFKGNAVEILENGAFFEVCSRRSAAQRGRFISRRSCGRTACSGGGWSTR
jgi:cardiolipin synthase A/B